MITTYLIISHLISDFILQPKRLVQWKIKSMLGILVHVLIVGLVSIIVLYPYINYYQFWIVILLIGIVHFFTDQAKINIELKRDASDIPFIADQGIHFLSLILAGHMLDTVLNINLTACYLWFDTCVYQNLSLWIAILIMIYLVYCVKIALMHKTRPTIYKKILIFSLVYLVYFGTVLVVFK